MKIPARIAEHPVESLFAAVLLLGLLFASSERVPERPQRSIHMQAMR
jgi:hypothetical protein